MSALTPPEISSLARDVVDKMLGTTLDIEEAMELAGVPFGMDAAPKLFFTFVDQRAWRCSDCDHWCLPGELDKKDKCFSCR